MEAGVVGSATFDSSAVVLSTADSLGLKEVRPPAGMLLLVAGVVVMGGMEGRPLLSSA